MKYLHIIWTGAGRWFVGSVVTITVIIVDMTKWNHFARCDTSERFAGLDVDVSFRGGHSRHVNGQMFYVMKRNYDVNEIDLHLIDFEALHVLLKYSISSLLYLLPFRS